MMPTTISERKRTRDPSDTSESPSSKRATWKSKGPNFTAPAEMVTFYIENNEEQPFQVHKEFACAYSPMLKAAFESEFVEGQTQTYRLKDVCPDAFRLLMQWFYTQTFDVYRISDVSVPLKSAEINKLMPLESEELKNALREQDLNLIQLWVVADRLLIPRLQNTAMKKLLEVWKDWVRTSSWIAYAYEHTSADSPLRQLAVDTCVDHFKEGDFEKNPNDFPWQVLFDVAKQVASSVAGDDKFVKTKSKHKIKRIMKSYFVDGGEDPLDEGKKLIPEDCLDDFRGFRY